MTPNSQHSPHTKIGATGRTPAPSRTAPCMQRGVVLFIALIMLIVISMLAVLSMRNATSTEAISGNVRTTELATQAAEIALRHCEAAVTSFTIVAGGGSPTYTSTFVAANIQPTSTTPLWQSIATWDSTSAAVYVLPLTEVNQAGLGSTYLRAPECMVEPVPVMLTGTTVLSTTAAYVITVRGFGPEVANNRNRPQGTEVWLQSHIEFQ